ncbi:MAG: ABC transporter ATP-binding protein [Bacteroidota bacterium]|nr:ABC transporter ATP-binding protein [Bacteroidota bacterium]
MLTAHSIKKTYQNLPVLKGIDLTVQKGEIVAITGPSGAGKSTLLHILGTLDKPDEGSLEFEGQNISKLKDNQQAKFRNEKLGFVFQFHNLLPEFTAFENICIPAYIKGQTGAETEKRALELMDLLHISARRTHKPSEMSGGEQQRTAVARALINNPEIVFADEPSGNLDSNNARDLHQLFFDLRQKFGQAFVIVTHNNELAGMADRQLQMKDGILL